MTREELRDYVNEQRTLNNIPYHVYSALIDGIDTLEQEPSVSENPNNCDLISRKEAVKQTKELFDMGNYYCDKAAIVGMLNSLSPVKPQTGHWIRITNGGAMKQMYICSECRRRIEDDGIEALITIKYPYCHCGARMESEDKE